MMLFNGVACLVTAIVLLIQIKRSSGLVDNQFLLKVIWIQIGMLMIKAIHHIFNGLIDPSLNDFIRTLDPISDMMNVAVGIVLSLYLARKRNKLTST